MWSWVVNTEQETMLVFIYSDADMRENAWNADLWMRTRSKVSCRCLLIALYRYMYIAYRI